MFDSFDKTRLAYHEQGDGEPLVCLPGGPGRASAYLGDLGGLSATHRLIKLDTRGSGESAVPEDPATYRCDRLVDDVEALRDHLGLERMDLLAHSAAGNLGLLYAARHPERLRKLVLVTPGARAAGVETTDEEWHAALAERSGEPWYADAHAAVMAWERGEETAENEVRAAPFFYGRWDETVAAHAAGEVTEVAPAVAAGYAAEGAFDPEATRAALAALTVPVLVYAGRWDPAPTPARAAELAGLFPAGRLVVDQEAGHFPWVTGPKAFAETVEEFLR